ncbi:MAG: hypothetical protein ACK5S6_00865 [bacterium]|jgi:hypothetical protein
MGNTNILTIRTTPRTGSNLLMHSLASHPEVKSAGEYYCTDESRCTAQAWANKKSGDWNLTKTFFFEEPPKPGPTVFLYRQDMLAQYNSYLKACETGEWMHGMVSPPVKPIRNFLELVSRTSRDVGPKCDLIVKYEDLMLKWDSVISSILELWGIANLRLDMATTKQT